MIPPWIVSKDVYLTSRAAGSDRHPEMEYLVVIDGFLKTASRYGKKGPEG
jgi:hypothetical protein